MTFMHGTDALVTTFRMCGAFLATSSYLFTKVGTACASFWTMR